jgi:thiol-disulfide isomerase/thioredoxin
MKALTTGAGRWVILALAGICAVAGGIYWAYVSHDDLVGRDAAQILTMELPDLDGKPSSLAKYRGKVLFINFWATWCVPCREEMPEFIRAQTAEGANGVQFAGIAVDQADKVRQFAENIGVNYPTLVGGIGALELSKNLGNQLMALPYTVVVDRRGRIAYTHLGPLKPSQLADLLRKLK